MKTRLNYGGTEMNYNLRQQIIWQEMKYLARKMDYGFAWSYLEEQHSLRDMNR